MGRVKGRAAGSSSRHVLLVEDHEDSAEMMTLLLQSEGYSVHWVSTAGGALDVFAAEAFDAASNPRPDVILLDLTLPDIDGLEVGRRLRQSVPNVPPIVVMSAKSTNAVVSAAASIQAAGYVRKPFARDVLVGSLESAITGHSRAQKTV
jgi:DNA-binding response OmpR family regulator